MNNVFCRKYLSFIYGLMSYCFKLTGVNPYDIRGTRTGVYVGMMTNESADYFERTPEKLTGYETIGVIRSMLANRVSFQFNFNGINQYNFQFNPICWLQKFEINYTYRSKCRR